MFLFQKSTVLRRMELNKYTQRGLAVLALALVTVLGLTVGVPLAEQPQGPWLGIELSFAPAETSVGTNLLGTLVVRNLGAEETTFDAVAAELPQGMFYVGQAVGTDVRDAAAVGDGELRWAGPFALAPGAELQIRYWLVARDGGSLDGLAVGTAVYAGDQVLTSADFSLSLAAAAASAAPLAQSEAARTSSPVQLEALEVTKTAEPTSILEPGRGVAYEVVFSNTGESVMTLDRITDMLPAPFQYVGLAVGSDVEQEPADGQAPEIVWTGAFDVPASGTLTLRYWAWVPADTPRQTAPYTNSVTAQSGSTTTQPASAGVTVGRQDTTTHSVFMPLALKSLYIAPPIPPVQLHDDFEQGDGNWTAYTNLSRLNEEQWYPVPNEGYNDTTGYRHYWLAGRPSPEKGAEDALSMYLGPGAYEWSNYRARVKFNVHGGKKAGLWFLGTYQGVETRGQWFVGYYCMVAVKDDKSNDDVQLKQMRTYDDYGEYPPVDERNYYHFTNPFDLAEGELAQNLEDNNWYELTVEVRTISQNAVNIKCYVDNELAIDYTDSEGDVFTKGTIGLKTYGSQGDYAVMTFDDVIVEPLD